MKTYDRYSAHALAVKARTIAVASQFATATYIACKEIKKCREIEYNLMFDRICRMAKNGEIDKASVAASILVMQNSHEQTKNVFSDVSTFIFREMN